MGNSLVKFLAEPVVSLVNNWPWLAGIVNRFAINATVNVSRHRPHPWSTVHDYVSWTSLTDQRWSARHLPAVNRPNPPPPENLLGLFRRPAGGQLLCPKSTCLFPAFAQYLTDGFIRTRMPDEDKHEPEEVRLQNTSNHQIDLCPLYGRLPSQTGALRLNSDARGERGRLRSQRLGDEEFAPFYFRDGAVDPQFAYLDPPLGVDKSRNPELLFAFGGDRANGSPQVAMMNTLFLREHNRLAGEIERAQPDWDDERVFQTARNALIVIFIKIVVEEYINHISPSPFNFLADPEVAWDAPWNKPNWITTEFSLLYRWHSLLPDSLTWNQTPYPVGSLILNNRPLLDGGLLCGFIDMSGQQAGRLGPFNTADALLPMEERAIKQDRLCRLAPYTDYRRYVGMKAPDSFEEISTNSNVVDFLKASYGSPTDIDFYVGLFAEDTVANSPLPPLILRMVAVDAFSQALTNPLLSRAVFNKETFSAPGWDAVQQTRSLRDVLQRNVSASIGDARIAMTLSGWSYSWT